MNSDTSVGKGKEGESKAVSFLMEQGHELVTTNFRNRIGEIDIVSFKKQKLFLIEVKSWNPHTGFEPLETFTKNKIQKMRRIAEIFLINHPKYKNYFVSFSLISIKHDSVEFYTDLF